MSPESIVSYRFRFGHSLVKRSIDRCNKEFRQVPFNVELHKEMNNPSNLHNFGSVDRILLGLSSQKLSRRDEFITDELTNHLFQVSIRHSQLFKMKTLMISRCMINQMYSIISLELKANIVSIATKCIL